MTFEIHILPLIPGSLNDALCCFEMGVGCGESMRDCIILTISSVFRSHLVEVGESQRECHSAVLNKKGTLGRTMRATAFGLETSMLL